MRSVRRGTVPALLAVAFLVAVAIGTGLFALGALSNLWAEYQDSSTGTYLLIGLPALAVCVASLLAAVRLWRS